MVNPSMNCPQPWKFRKTRTHARDTPCGPVGRLYSEIS